ncbi:hypothetical protein L9F63_006271, partial [Diploptera punctata]
EEFHQGAYLYRRERKKRHRKLSERISDSLDQKKVRRRGGGGGGGGDRSSEDGSSTHSQREADDSDDGEEMTSSEAESSGEAEEERVPLELSDTLKRVLEEDYDFINEKNKIVKLPADPNVVTILEGYMKHCAVNQLCVGEKPQRRYRYNHYQNNKSRDLERACRSLNICKEVVDGVRIYFDFTLCDLLLYNPERMQFEQIRNHHPEPTIKQEIEVYDTELNDVVVKEEDDDGVSIQGHEGEIEADDHSHFTSNNITNMIHHPVVEECHTLDNGETIGEGDRKRSLRSHRAEHSETISSDVNGTIKTISRIASTSSRCSTPTTSLPAITVPSGSVHSSASPKHSTLLSQILTWQLVPQSLYNEVPVAPSLVYGAIHLLRLFVKLPDLLYATNMPERKLKILLQQLDMFLNYMEEHQEWFGEKYYKDNATNNCMKYHYE